MKITRDRKNRILTISQNDYTMPIIDKFGMKDCNPVSTPAVGPSINQPTDSILDEEGIKLCQSMVGMLLCKSRTTRWDISYAVLQLTKATSKPSKTNLTRAKLVLRYLQDQPDLPIAFKSGHFNLSAFADASCANDPDKRR